MLFYNLVGVKLFIFEKVKTFTNLPVTESSLQLHLLQKIFKKLIRFFNVYAQIWKKLRVPIESLVSQKYFFIKIFVFWRNFLVILFWLNQVDFYQKISWSLNKEGKNITHVDFNPKSRKKTPKRCLLLVLDSFA